MPSPAAATPTRVLIVDAHDLFRRGLQMVLAPEVDIEVVGEGEDAASAMVLAASHRPDLVLVDADLVENVGALSRALVAAAPGAQVLLLTSAARPVELTAAVAAGAAGILAKETSVDELTSAIRSTAERQRSAGPTDVRRTDWAAGSGTAGTSGARAARAEQG